MAQPSDDEGCAHDMVFHGLCTLCGENVDRLVRTGKKKSDDAKVSLLHDTAAILVTADVAERETTVELERLRSARKLALFCDLDQTLIHADVDPTLEAWIAEGPKNPNHEALKDIARIRLHDDPNVYFIKPRPGVQEFLEEASKLYELHIYTAGSRAYALEVAKVLDPQGKYFRSRVLHRDANGSASSKNIDRIHHGDRSMAVALDDRAEVWDFSPNLLKIKPFRFYPNVGDINNPAAATAKILHPEEVDGKKKTVVVEEEEAKEGVAGEEGKGEQEKREAEQEDKQEEDTDEEGGEEEKSDKKDGEEQDDEATSLKRSSDGRLKKATFDALAFPAGDERPLAAQQRLAGPSVPILHNRDRDLLHVTLPRLQSLHQSFYTEYDRSARADISVYLKDLRYFTLRGSTLAFDPSLRINSSPAWAGPSPLELLTKGAEWIGAKVSHRLRPSVTHYVTRSPRGPGMHDLTRTLRAHPAAYRHLHVVQDGWLRQCIDRWSIVPESDFLVRSDRELFGADGRPKESKSNNGNGNGNEDGDRDGNDDEDDEDEDKIPDEDNNTTPSSKKRRVNVEGEDHIPKYQREEEEEENTGPNSDDDDANDYDDDASEEKAINIDWASAWDDIEAELGSELDDDTDADAEGEHEGEHDKDPAISKSSNTTASTDSTQEISPEQLERAVDFKGNVEQGDGDGDNDGDGDYTQAMLDIEALIQRDMDDQGYDE